MTQTSSLRRSKTPRFVIEQHARVVGQNDLIERYVLSMLLLMFYVTYGAIGRDVFFNHMYDGYKQTIDDPIGAYLPYARILTCFVSLIFVVARTDIAWAVSKVPWMLLPFCMFIMLTAFWTDDPKSVIRNSAMTFAMWFCISPLIHRLGLAATVRTSLFLIAIVCLASFLIAVFEPSIGRHTGLEASQTSHRGEWRGIFSHKNGLGPWTAWGTAFLLTYARRCAGPRLFWWAAWLAAVVCLYNAHSATAVAMAVFLVLIQVFFFALRRFTLGTIALVAVPFVVGTAILFTVDPDSLFSLLGRDSTFTGRTEIWRISIEFAQQRLWIGHGFQLLGGQDLLTRLYVLFGQPLGPENGFMVMVLDIGVIGLILFVVPYLLAIRNAFEWLKFTSDTDRSNLEMLIGILLASILGSMTIADLLFSTGYDGVFSFIALFAMLTTPKSPPGVLRGEWRMAKYRLADRAGKTNSRFSNAVS